MYERGEQYATYPVTRVSMSPMTHILNVRHGISGSSMFDTDALTSGKGLSSSSIASKSNSILQAWSVSYA